MNQNSHRTIGSSSTACTLFRFIYFLKGIGSQKQGIQDEPAGTSNNSELGILYQVMLELATYSLVCVFSEKSIMHSCQSHELECRSVHCTIMLLL